MHPGTLTTQDLEYVSYVNSASDLEKRQYGIQYRIFRGGPDGSNYTLNSNDLSSTATMLAAIFTTDLAGSPAVFAAQRPRWGVAMRSRARSEAVRRPASLATQITAQASRKPT